MREAGPNSIDRIVRKYERLYPKTFTGRFSTGPFESEIIGKLWDREVRRTAQAFGFTRWTLEHCLVQKRAVILQHDTQGSSGHTDGSPGPTESDDYLDELVFDGNAQTLVSMLNKRDTSNFQVVQIARYPLTSAVTGSLERLVDFDNTRLIADDGAEILTQL